MKHIPTEFEVELVSGEYLDVTMPDLARITLNDIATPLAKECRYGGACEGFYSVAEHAVLVASKLRKMGEPIEMQFAGLHHDDAEFVLKDLQRPAKLALRSLDGHEGYRELTRRLDDAIWLTFAVVSQMHLPLWDLEMLDSPTLKAVDNWACAFEAHRIMPSRGANWGNVWALDAAVVPSHPDDAIFCWEWRQARAAYLDMHELLAAEALGTPTGRQSVA